MYPNQALGNVVGAGACDAKRQSFIPESIERLERTISELMKLSADLEARLCDVLRPSVPTPEGIGGNKALGEEQKPILAHRIDAFHGSVVEIRNRLRSVMERLEL